MANQLTVDDQVTDHWPLHFSALSPCDIDMWSMLEDGRSVHNPLVAEGLNQTYQTVLMKRGNYLQAEGCHFEYLL